MSSGAWLSVQMKQTGRPEDSACLWHLRLGESIEGQEEPESTSLNYLPDLPTFIF